MVPKVHGRRLDEHFRAHYNIHGWSEKIRGKRGSAAGQPDRQWSYTKTIWSRPGRGQKRIFADMGFLIPQADAKQALRIRRFFLAAISYLLWIAISYLCQIYEMSRIGMPAMFAIWGVIVLNNLFFYGLLRSGLNKKLPDPSLTIPQMLAAIFWSGVVSYIVLSPLRGSMLALFLVGFIFGVFKLSLRQFFLLVAVAMATYAVAMVLLYRADPAAVDPVLEGFRLILLLVTLMWFSLIGSYIQNLRTKVIKANSELQEAMKTIEELAIHDELTGVYNRRQMLTILNREKALADRTHTPFAVCLLDLDDFKKINDTYGHLAGDEVLRKFAQTIKSHIRTEDYIARYGGEEFLVIFTGRHCV
ncbi:MAG: GGDEF domain-containing protein, partial [Desulfosudaceae bacterium]